MRGGPHVRDWMPAFWLAYDAAHAAARPGEALFSRFFKPRLALYRAAGLAPEPALVDQWLRRFAPMAAHARARSARMPAALQAQLATFQAAFPDFDQRPVAVHFLPSLFQFDAHLEPCGATLPLYIGIDGILYYHGADPGTAVLFSHELFHLYQAQHNPGAMLDPAPPLHALLWSEGTATYASQLLNPRATRGELLFDNGPLLHLAPGTAARIAADLLLQCDSAQDADVQRYFSTGYRGDIPPRSGYLIGLDIAAHAHAGGMTPQRMAALPSAAAREVVRRRLQQLSSGQTRP
ncbi:hypothetical protein ASC94_21935 [Massilia sp. Root418]|jgi:hypothetical protein|uniref:hypothetical protein n=1 Tax=Massilia sp. Root418 TaxID=1736532 RepID=UPI0006F53452|nr:hypothetical protein [Massilia sp. Root418]KQW89122.1 hypothetical protein ASC94_21935 [Massilia sp. Root418]